MSTPIETFLTAPRLPIGDLVQLLEEVESLVDNVVGPWNQILFAEKDREAISEAWREVKAAIPSIISAVRDSSSQLLMRAGLWGKQLALKLGIVNEAWQEFKARGTSQRLQQLFKWIQTILASLVSIVPGGEAWREIAEFLEKLLEKNEE